MLRPQDILLVLKLVSSSEKLTFSELGQELAISPSQAFSAHRRAHKSGLIDADGMVRNRALAEVLVYGVKYFLPADKSGMARGVPTAYAAEPLRSQVTDSGEPPPVWPSSSGTVRGIAYSPIYKSAPVAAMADPALYEWLALVDAIRIGRARESNLARELICQRLGVSL